MSRRRMSLAVAVAVLVAACGGGDAGDGSATTVAHRLFPDPAARYNLVCREGSTKIGLGNSATWPRASKRSETSRWPRADASGRR